MAAKKQSTTKPQVVFFRGDFIPYQDAKISVMAHGLNYGTGCFEGIRGYGNDKHQELYVLKMKPHFERIHQSARILHMNLSYDVHQLCELAIELVRRNGYKEDVYIRPLLFMGDEIIGV